MAIESSKTKIAEKLRLQKIQRQEAPFRKNEENEGERGGERETVHQKFAAKEFRGRIGKCLHICFTLQSRFGIHLSRDTGHTQGGLADQSKQERQVPE